MCATPMGAYMWLDSRGHWLSVAGRSSHGQGSPSHCLCGLCSHSIHHRAAPSPAHRYRQGLESTYIYVSGNPQPEAIGHTQTCLQPDLGPVPCTVCSLVNWKHSDIMRSMPVFPDWIVSSMSSLSQQDSQTPSEGT